MKIKLNYGVCIWDPHFKKDTEIRKINSEERIKNERLMRWHMKITRRIGLIYLKKDEGESPNTYD